MILLRKLFYSQGNMYFCWPITCKQLLNNLRVNMLTSVVKIQVSRLTSQTYLTIHITMVFAGCTIIVCLVDQYQKKMAKNCFIYLFMELFTDLKSAVLEWCMLHNTFHLTFLTMHKFQSFKLIREPYFLELKIFLKEQFHKITESVWV